MQDNEGVFLQIRGIQDRITAQLQEIEATAFGRGRNRMIPYDNIRGPFLETIDLISRLIRTCVPLEIQRKHQYNAGVLPELPPEEEFQAIRKAWEAICGEAQRVFMNAPNINGDSSLWGLAYKINEHSIMMGMPLNVPYFWEPPDADMLRDIELREEDMEHEDDMEEEHVPFEFVQPAQPRDLATAIQDLNRIVNLNNPPAANQGFDAAAFEDAPGWMEELR